MSNLANYLTLLKKRPQLLVLVLCLILGGGLRLVGLTRGISDFDPAGRAGQTTFYHFHPDEETLIRAALALETPFEPPLTAYGLLPLYALRGALVLVDLIPGAPALDLATTEGQIWVFLTARVMAVVLSWLSLVLVYWLGRRCFDAGVAVLATFFVAVAPVVVQQAHFYTVDGVVVFFSLACFCALARMLDDGGWRWALVVGVCVGATAAVRLNGVLLVAVIVGALMVRDRDRLQRNGWIAAGSAALVLGLLQPYLLAQPELLWRSETSADLAYSLGIARGEVLKPWTLFDVGTTPYVHYWTALMPLAVGWLVTVFFAVGFCAGFRHRQPLRLAVVGWAAICFLLVGGLHTKHVRYLLPMVPLLALLAADIYWWVLGRVAGRRRVVGMAIAVLGAGWYGVAFAGVYAAEDSRIEAGRWMLEQVPEGRVVGVEKGAFSLGAVVDDERYRQETLNIARLFNGRPYLSCRAAAHFLGRRLERLDYLALVDANRLVHFMAVPQLYPAVAGFYSRLAAGEMGFAQVARFKRYPEWGGLVFADDGVEPSFIGYDHPAVLVFAKRGDVADALRRWERALDADPHCPDAALNEIGRLLGAGRDEEALRATHRLASQRPYWQLPHLVATWIHARRGDAEAELASVERYRASFFTVGDAHYGPWASALSFARAQMPDLAVTALAEGALQVAEYPTPVAVRRAMGDSFGEIARLLERQGRVEHARAAQALAGEVVP
ncbi:MAG: glycosyltransferase family 39 protein [Candidatus Latescibacterota bacterium]|nr:glycosyltransferase family 39 protein [Candidatus Latescibacterota bacterium]